jgi:hypothetical protein
MLYGVYDPDTASIHIARDVEHKMIQTFFHELAHMVENDTEAILDEEAKMDAIAAFWMRLFRANTLVELLDKGGIK